MRPLLLGSLTLILAVPCLADDGPAPMGTEEPRLIDHYMALQQMQERMSQHSLDEQERLQPRLHRAELAACRKLRKDREERVPRQDYLQQGGLQFDAFVQQFERYCQTLTP